MRTDMGEHSGHVIVADIRAVYFEKNVHNAITQLQTHY